MTFFYDDSADVMYIYLADEAGPCLYVESSGAILRIERETKKLVSVTIPAFHRTLEDGALVLPEVATAALPHGFLDSIIGK
jgi:hypothetical protein